MGGAGAHPATGEPVGGTSKRRLLVAGGILIGLLSAGCQDQETTSPVETPPSYTGTLELEIRGTAEVTWTGQKGQEASVSVKVAGAEAAHLVDDGTVLEGPGRVEPLPEAGSELLAAKLSLPADPAGPCGAQGRAVALSLHHRAGAARFAGALTVYCGDQHFGVPARVLRLSGTLEQR